MLRVFLDHPQRVLTRDQLLNLTQGRQADPFDRSIDLLVSRLRQRLRDVAREPRYIKTLRSEGYVFSAAVTHDRRSAMNLHALLRWPRTLFARLALILFVGLALAQTLSFWLTMTERDQSMTNVMMGYIEREVASSVALLDHSAARRARGMAAAARAAQLQFHPRAGRGRRAARCAALRAGGGIDRRRASASAIRSP